MLIKRAGVWLGLIATLGLLSLGSSCSKGGGGEGEGPGTETGTPWTAKGDEGTISGTVAFTDGANTISKCASVSLTNKGKATVKTARCSTSSLAVGTHSIGATYSGNAANNGSSATLSQTVSP